MSRATATGTATVRLLCRTFGISRQAYYGVQRRRATTGKVVVLPARPGVASAEAVLKAIRAVIAREPAWGVRKVWATLRRDGLHVSRKRVWALMHANGLVLAAEREPGGPPPRGHVVVPEPNRRFATDLTTVWTRREGWVAVALTIDGGCRTLLGLDVTKDQSAAAILRSIDRVLLEQFGNATAVPTDLELRSDHGPQYTGADCEALATRWG
jgi:transposase InsO family protein